MGHREGYLQMSGRARKVECVLSPIIPITPPSLPLLPHYSDHFSAVTRTHWAGGGTA
jgi:hypothetical protein